MTTPTAFLNRNQTICFAVHDLCLHPEYITPLRAELESSDWTDFEKTGRGLPLLDSFIKESARTNPVESSKSPTFSSPSAGIVHEAATH